MSQRKINLMRVVLDGILAALAVLGLMQIRVLAEGPKPKPAASHFILLSGHLAAPLPPALRPAPGLSAAKGPGPAPAPTPWMAPLDPSLLLAAMRDFAAPAATEPIHEAKLEPLRAPAAATPAELGAPVALQVTTHHSVLVTSPLPLTRVSLTDDAIAQALVVSPTQVLIQGKAPGEVSLLTWDADNSTRAYTVQVGLDPQPLQGELSRLFPGSGLRVSASGDALVVSGTMANAASAKQVLAVAAGFSKNIVSNLGVDAAGDPGQVLLQVRFAEVDRSAVSQFGANLLSTGSGAVGTLSTGQFGPPASVTTPHPQNVPANSATGTAATVGLSSLLNVFLFNRDINLGATLQALEQQNLLQILAEPNLVAMDGKDASFLAGGEFPFPVVQGQGSVNNVTIQFKPFGVNLHFRPTILPDGTIDLQVAPEVSALDFSNALTVSGFLIPALSTRRAQTELELHDGQSFVIAGLMDNRLTTNASKIPGLGDIPILGQFFRSHSTSRSRSELMVVVTAHLAHPLNGEPPTGPRMPKPFLPGGDK